MRATTGTAKPRSGISAAQVALSLAEEFSLPVFPCGADKKPRTANGFKDASRSIEQIGEWFDGDALVAVPTGRASNLLVVDIDPVGSSWYTEHREQLAAGRVHKTRRGHHLIYKMPAAEIRNSAGKLAPGVDVRAEGGYVIWWPAHGLEATGDLSDVADPPAWLIDALNVRTEPKGLPLNGAALSEGGRNDALTRLAGKLRRDGLNDVELEAALIAANQQRCSPPLARDEVRTIAKSVARYEPAKPTDDVHQQDSPIEMLALDVRLWPLFFAQQ
jgi:putative DNA primase/helicase